MNILPVQTREDGNASYPLPPDYKELTKDGQREARINGCRQWCLGWQAIAKILYGKDYYDLSPEELAAVVRYKSEAAAASVWLFDTLYLRPFWNEEGEAVWDPLFYKGTWVETPPWHLDIARAGAVYPASAWVGPRGGAKSSALLRMGITELVTKPGYEELYCTSTHDLSKIAGERVRTQVYFNARIFNDWSKEPEFGGRIMPFKGEALQGTTDFTLRNQSAFRCSSAESRQRGRRPMRYFFDDPEYDPKKSTSMEVIRAEMDDLLFRVIMPMLQRADASVIWAGTLISKRHYLWKVMNNIVVIENGVPVSQPKDKRFKHWFRKIQTAVYEGPDGKLHSCWPHNWPLDAEEKKRLRCPPGTPTIEDIKERVGLSVWDSEYMAKPGSGVKYFGELKEEKHGYWYDPRTIDEHFHSAPWMSKTHICWHSVDGRQRSMPLNVFLKLGPRFITLDTSYTAESTSDYKCCTCMMMTPDRELFVLDTWQGQCPQDTLVDEAFRMADKWRAVSFHPEAIREGISLCHELAQKIRMRAWELMGLTHCPLVEPLHPGKDDKGAKVGALLWRFTGGLIKLPMREKETPQWAPLFEQIEGANPNVADLGLEHDDAVDTVAMSMFVVRIPKAAQEELAKQPAKSPLELWREGKRVDAAGVPLLYSVWQDLTLGDLAQVMEDKAHPKNQRPEGVI